MIRLVHYAAGAVAVAAALAFLLFGFTSAQMLDDNRSLPDKLVTWFTPSARRSDFVGHGWRHRKLQWLAGAVLIVALLVWGATG